MMRSFITPLRWPILLLMLALTPSPRGFSAAARNAPAAAFAPASTSETPAAGFSTADEAFLDDVERRGFRFFREQSDPGTGLTADRARADGRAGGGVASTAATGFGLTALCVADHRDWIPHEETARRALTTLRFLHDGLPHHRGFFYHFVERATGRRAWGCEVSSIDTALLLAGVLSVREHFRATPPADAAAAAEIEGLATGIFERVDWPWMLAGGKTLSMGWTPEAGFLPHRWDQFSEHPILTLLAMGSRAHPLPPECWSAWRRTPVATYAGHTFLQCPPLFVHQFPHAWIDFRGRRDAWGDYWHNSVEATLAHRQFCIDLASRRPRTFGHFGPNLWGITASDSAGGYRSWGGPDTADPGTIDPQLDGTLVPCAAAGSLPFAPRVCLDALRAMRETYGGRIWKRYGFVDAFNPRTGWVGPDVIGIDVGITLLMAENCRSGFVWELFMKGEEIRRGLNAAGFRDEGQAKKAA